ncbi:MAG: hypothetical protein JWQ14_2178 [Adhaeribacter sp.]|nr:hypothetical protein [Adhaeribacter sp.]
MVKKGYQAFGIYNDKNGKANQKSYEHWVNTHIELPLLVKFSVGNKKTKFFLAAGPAFSFWNSSYFNRNATGENAVREKFKVEHKFRQTLFKQIDTVTVNGIENIIQTAFDSITVKARSEISAVFATGFHYKLKKSLIIFDIRYGYGLTPLFSYLEDKRPLNYKDGFPAENIPPKSKEFNRRFSFSVSYLFAFKN